MHLDLTILPESTRAARWAAALADLGLTSVTATAATLSGALSVRSFSSGVRIARLIAPAQGIRPRDDGHTEPAPLRVILTLRSRGRVSVKDHVQYFAQNDLVVLGTGAGWRLHWSSEVKAILLEFPHETVTARLGRHRPNRPMVLGSSTTADMARSMLGVLAAQFDTLGQDDLTASEGPLLDLLCQALNREADGDDGPMTAVQVAHYRRVGAAIDARLMTPDLSLSDIAVAAGLSPRYVQRLFELRDDSFSRHIRQKRLERSRADLMDISQNAVGIAQIAHRWGFASASHFSRSFRDAFGVSPRALRADNHDTPLPYAFRGNPGHTADPLGASRAPQAAQPTEDTVDGLPEPAPGSDATADFVLPVRADTVHWGHISRAIPPVLYVPSGSVVRIETLTQHGGDDYARFVEGDPGAESVFHWTRDAKAVDRRGAGPMDASIFGRGAGEGFGVHICTGPIHVTGAEPGDILEVEILDIAPRPSANPLYRGKAFGSNVSH